MADKKKKILMIEDDLFLRKIYRDKLTKAGFLFIEATNGVEGMNKVISEGPDLILLDVMLPMKSGFDVLIDIKSNQNTQKIPVIILSNLGQKTDIERGFSLGADDYLVKTEISISEVVSRARGLLIKKSAKEE